MNPSNQRAVCPGSYDPITNGHLDVINRAAELFDQVIVGVVNVPIRKGKTLFSTEDRIAMVAESTSHLPNVTAKPFSNLVVEFARECGAKAIVKGLRAISDFEYEFEMNQLNRMQAARHRVRLSHGVPAVQFPELQRHQGAGHVRRRCERSRAPARGAAIEGSARRLTNRG